MAPEAQRMFNALGLLILQGGQIRHSGGFSFLQNRLRQLLQARPTVPVHLGRMRNAPQHAAPFNDDAVDVACAQEFSYPPRLASGSLCTLCTTSLAPQP